MDRCIIWLVFDASIARDAAALESAARVVLDEAFTDAGEIRIGNAEIKGSHPFARAVTVLADPRLLDHIACRPPLITARRDEIKGEAMFRPVRAEPVGADEAFD